MHKHLDASSDLQSLPKKPQVGSVHLYLSTVKARIPGAWWWVCLAELPSSRSSKKNLSQKKKIWHWYLASYIYILLYLHTHLNKFTQNTWMQRYKHKNTQGKYTYIVKLDSLFLCRVMHSGIIMRYYLALVVLCWHPSQPTIIKNKETIMQNFVSNL